MPSVGTSREEALEELYQAVYTAVTNRRPISAVYDGRQRLFCPHRLGWNKDGELRVLCYQFGGESKSGLNQAGSSANWRCVALEKLSRIRLLDGAWQTAPNHSRPASCVVNPHVDAEDYLLSKR